MAGYSLHQINDNVAIRGSFLGSTPTINSATSAGRSFWLMVFMKFLPKNDCVLVFGNIMVFGKL
jgi:hypothetical protein